MKPIGNALSRSLAWLATGLSWHARGLYERARTATRPVEVWVRHTVGLHQSETRLISESKSYWSNPSSRYFKQHSHWRGGGIFADDSRWLALGREHLRLYEEFARVVSLKQPLKRIVEWGCGGGMNAIHFGRVTHEYCGIDIAPASLEECGRQMTLAGLSNFSPVLIDASDPEAALARVQGPSDLFISTYVFELLPTPEYGIRVLRIANALLAPGGMAIVQIKYHDNWRTASRTWNYAKNLAWNATYRIEEFWAAAEQCGFTPKMLTLVPKQPLINDRNYAYFLLLKHNTLWPLADPTSRTTVLRSIAR